MIPFGADYKPSKLEKNKSEKYHLQMARFFVNRGIFDSRHTHWVRKIKKLKDFYTGNQWVQTEDLSAFFLDVSGNPTTRIKMVFNIIRPMVEQYRGNAIRMDMNGQVYSVGTQSFSRRVKRLERLEYYDKLSRKMPALKEAISSKLPIGETPDKTRENFENIDVDEYVDVMNSFLQNNLLISKAQQYQVRFAESLAYSGACIAFPFDYSGRWMFRKVEPENFFWDRNAREYDLSDAEYWGEGYPMDTSKIFEMWPDIGSEKRTAIEEYARNEQMYSGYNTMYNRSEVASSVGEAYMPGRVPVYFVYWVDSDFFEYGWVPDEYGVPSLKRIIRDPKDEGYNERDIIPNSKLTDKQRAVIGKKSTKMIPCDTLRYAHIIPASHVDGSYANSTGVGDSDIVLDYGSVKYCEYDPFSPFNVEPPYKVNFWSYVDGQVYSPIEDAIDPQRLINRFMSVAENRVNNSYADNIAYDPDTVGTEQDSEAEFLANLAAGKPLRMKTRGRGIPNAVMPVQAGGMQSSMSLFNVIGSILGYSQHTTGINAEMQGGASMGTEQLVGVTEALIQRGSLLQEPFYNAISELYMGLYNSILSKGKHIYADNETELIDMVGTEGARLIKITSSLRNENFAAFVRRDAGNGVLKQAANQMLFTLLQYGIIKDEAFIAEHLNKSTPDTIAIALRRAVKANQQFAVESQQAEEQAVLAAQAEQNAQIRSSQEMQKNLMAREDMQREKDREHDMDKIMAKGLVDAMKK